MNDYHLLNDSLEEDTQYNPECFIKLIDYLENSSNCEEIDNHEALSLCIIDPLTIQEYRKAKTYFPPKISFPSKVPQKAPRKIQQLTARTKNFAKERREKVKKYLDKRKKRISVRKIEYNCRQEAASNRIRVRGRFVSKQHAEMLSMDK